VGADLLDAGVHDLDVVLGECGIPLVGDKGALAPEQVVGSEPLAQLRVGHVPAQVPARGELEHLHDPRAVDEAGHEQELLAPVDHGPGQLLEQREATVGAALEASRGAVGARHDPRRGALKDVERAHARLDLGHELDRRGARADHPDALAVEVVVVVPLGRVEDLALEASARPGR